MKVIETWDIDVHSMTNTLFKTFNKRTGITDVGVSQIINNEEIAFNKKNVEVLHVDKNCYYSLVNSKGQYEIAWGINERSGKKTYKLEYTIEDAVINYNDCSELYWQFIGKDFEVDIDKVVGKIKIPNGAEDNTDIRVWAHGPLNGNIEMDSLNQASFEIEYLDSGNYLEVRIAMPTKLFASNTNIVESNRIETILQEEIEWANQANEVRQRIVKQEQSIKTASIVIISILIIFFTTKIIKYNKLLKDNPKKEPTQKLDYYRDIPIQDASPAYASFLYYFDKIGIKNNIPKIFSAIMLDLCLKNYLEFENVDKKIIVHIRNGNKQLSEDEEIIYNLLNKIEGKQENAFTMKELEKYAKKNYSSFLNNLDKIENIAKKENEIQGNFDQRIRDKKAKWETKSILYLICAIFIIIFSISTPFILIVICMIISIICMILCRKLSKRFNGLTQKGIDEKEKWDGLKKYMEDFSMLDDKTVPELILWEKYLVYATAFGIADKVLKQLKIVYPQIMDDNFHSGTYLGLMYYNNLNNNFIHSLEHGVNSAYNGSVSARATYDYSNSSSGGGFGGGFSSGGGFGGGGGGRRSVAKTKENVRKIKIKCIKKLFLKENDVY